MIVQPAIEPEQALIAPRLVTLKGALASVEQPAQNAIAPDVVQEEMPTEQPAAGVEQKRFAPRVKPPMQPLVAVIAPAAVTLKGALALFAKVEPAQNDMSVPALAELTPAEVAPVPISSLAVFAAPEYR